MLWRLYDNQTKRRPVSGSSKTRLLRPIAPPRNRTSEVVDRIAAEIRGGVLGPGDRLPTEQALMVAMGVSRTVVREAVSALKAEGLVVTRQGSGAFVSKEPSRVAFRIDSAAAKLDEVISVMELRLAVEVEAAALAAERASSADRARIRKAQATFASAIAAGETAVKEDFAFHLAVAHAMRNARFADFLVFLGHHVIPRQSVRETLTDAAALKGYLTRIAREHERIIEAIEAGEPAEARKAMRLHLTNGLERYRRLAARAGKTSDQP